MLKSLLATESAKIEDLRRQLEQIEKAKQESENIPVPPELRGRQDYLEQIEKINRQYKRKIERERIAELKQSITKPKSSQATAIAREPKYMEEQLEEQLEEEGETSSSAASSSAASSSAASINEPEIVAHDPLVKLALEGQGLNTPNTKSEPEKTPKEYTLNQFKKFILGQPELRSDIKNKLNITGSGVAGPNSGGNSGGNSGIMYKQLIGAGYKIKGCSRGKGYERLVKVLAE
jgi:hypothetical protein